MDPALVTAIGDVREQAALARQRGHSIACVPTMGALHEGHAMLIRRAKEISDFVVVTVFVNPTQFGPNEDFLKYPRTLAADLKISQREEADLVFAPAAEEIFPPDSYTTVEVAKLDDHLCGASRPGHFRGVATVVLKFINIVQPEVAVFGAKDGQQVRIIRQMVRDLNVPVKIDVVPTVRETDGLAMSSRNRYLTPSERTAAPAIFRALLEVRDRANAGETDIARLESTLQARLAEVGRVDYARIVDDVTLQPVVKLEKPAIAAVAVYLGSTRLIDNITLP